MADLFALLEFGPDGWGDEIAAGAWLTIRLAVATLPLGLFLGFLIALARDSSHAPLRIFGDAFATVFRGLPELLTLFIIYYGGQIALQKLVNVFAETYVEINGFVAGMIALGVVFAAFSSEVFLAALRAISKGQIEAARALGLTPFQTLRLVTFPQLWRYALPGIANLWLVLLKDTSLVSIIALNDLLRMTNVAVGATKQPFFFYLVACMIYLMFSIVSSIGIVWVERWAARGERRAA
ncbi:amino acid ABC transporter membrane protein 1 (PAAT family) [Tepidamorphus gemmatus]|uniref:Amino acid ABC transporter membrane protein 1 (PAAT family) n=1 Tax=Tepidamorphus gemmatus TaxID=747076 RepID=A0A4R3MNC7_9HYPH|nr:ABC transporter permease [Tepidamorphus gemmatus]TCT13546.1 amino acid ABC transporter membrane protein 1 (PAAT family) [Tepidamorphus gemmatus]